MPTFVMTGKYSPGVAKQISAERSAKGNKIVQQCGGTNATVYATMGESDVLAIADFPSIHDAMKASVELARELGISFATVPAIRMDEFDKLVAARP